MIKGIGSTGSFILYLFETRWTLLFSSQHSDLWISIVGSRSVLYPLAQHLNLKQNPLFRSWIIKFPLVIEIQKFR